MPHSPIGLIGCGLLGSALAERMLAGGFTIVGYDVDAGARERLRQLGGQAANSAGDLTSQTRTLVFCLSDSCIVHTVARQLQPSLSAGTTIIDATTGDPDESAALAERLAYQQVGFVDATIAGSSDQARRGEAVLLIGGRPADIAQAQPILDTWSTRQFFLGPPGSGARMKLIINLVLGLNRAVLAEGLSLAERCGLDLAATLAVLQATPAYSAAMDTKGAKMISGDFSPAARLAQHLKDVKLIRELAQRHGAATPLSDVHKELLQRAVELGFGEADNSAVIQAFLSRPRP